jgi:hypothetical protein
MLSSAMAPYYMRYGYMCKEYMRVAASFGPMLPIR